MKKPLFSSFFAHILIALALGIGYAYLGTRPAADVPMEVTLSDVHVHHADATKPARPKKAPPVTGTKAPAPAPAESAAPAPENAAAGPATGPAGDSAWGGLNEGQRNEYLARLQRIIASHQYYPRAAILNEQEGVVKLRVRLNEQGAITSCDVGESSGHALLDEAAVATVRKIGSFPLPAPESKGIVLVIPIRYEINPAH